MNSFRELSTRSVENALASHAKRQERGGITARSTVFLALFIGTLLLVAAVVLDVIPFGILVIAAMIATAVSGGELAYKMWLVKEKVRKTAEALLLYSEEEDLKDLTPEVRSSFPEIDHDSEVSSSGTTDKQDTDHE